MIGKTNRVRETQNDLAHVDALMNKLAQESPKQAPLRVRQHMTEAVQQFRASEASSANRWLLVAAVLLAALGLTAGTIIFKRSDHRAHATSEIVVRANSQPTPTVLEAPSLIPSTPSHAKAMRPQRPKFANPQPVFVALPFSDPALMSGTSVTIRLALSEAELLAMGVRPIESNSSGSYVADLVLGDDGLPRAIRIVSNNGPRIQGGS